MMKNAATLAPLTTSTQSHGASGHIFFRHLLEMIGAMIAGMVVLGAVVSLIFALLGHSNLFHYVTLRALLMATYMTVGMSVYMCYRGHSWPRVWEMAGAMYAPFLLLMVPFWLGLVSGAVFLVGGHILMLPCMVGAMLYRRTEYSEDHRHHSSSPAAEPETAHVLHF
jgi:hypothetical protein